ncbi:MAG: hypothetical protein Q7T82_10275 [Armatimonadota bacterium]|nr:hypothetical protein [Armatimonadota bacterium]
MIILRALLNIDRRIMYGLLCLTIVVMLKWPVKQPLSTTHAVKGVYDAVEAIPHDKIAIVSIVWSSSTMAENGPQTEAIMRHLFKRGIRFAILPWDQQGATLAKDIAEKVSAEMGKTYGVDWCDWGYRPAYLYQILPALAKDIPATIKKDYRGEDVRKLPMMRGVKTIHDVGLVADITPSGTLDAWISQIQGVYKTPIVFAPTLVMVPEAYNPLDAGQIKGMLPGLPGAGQYEQMLNYVGFGQKGSGALSGSFILIIVLIILGNVGLVASRRRRPEDGGGD